MPVRYTKKVNTVVRTRPVQVQSSQMPSKQVMPMPKPTPGTGVTPPRVEIPKPPKAEKPKKVVAVGSPRPIERSNSQSVEFILKAKKK